MREQWIIETLPKFVRRMGVEAWFIESSFDNERDARKRVYQLKVARRWKNRRVRKIGGCSR